NHLNFSGTGFVDYDNIAGSYVQWTVNAATAGTATLAFRHANGSTANRPMNITVNGAPAASGVAFNPTGNWDTWATVTVNITVNGTLVAGGLAFNPTGSWDTWANQTFSANLNAGTNKVRATAVTSNGGPNVDRLRAGTSGGGGGAPTAADLLAKVTTCSQIS